MFKINDNYLKLPGSYLFSTIAKKVAAYTEANPDAKIIRLGIGDVTQPIAPAIIEKLHGAVDEMGHERPSTDMHQILDMLSFAIPSQKMIIRTEDAISHLMKFLYRTAQNATAATFRRSSAWTTRSLYATRFIRFM